MRRKLHTLLMIVCLLWMLWHALKPPVPSLQAPSGWNVYSEVV